MQADPDMAGLLRRYGGSAPRYTSYPSAAHFRNEFPPENYVSCLRALPENAGVSLYVHIPFCRQLCHYCGCFTKVVRTDDPVRRYLDYLKREVDLTEKVSGRRLNAGHIHFGGGSPNVLGGDDMRSLMAVLAEKFSFTRDIEIAMEVDPRQMNAQKAAAYAAAGINRVSLGVQDFTEETQRAVNRIQPPELIADCVMWLRTAGIGAVNFDLMYGLPFQTVETVAQNAATAAALGASRVALFGYAHVSWMRPHQKNLERYNLPDAVQRYKQARAARAVFLDRGYVEIGMDHFARPDDAMAVAAEKGTLHRNFQGYTTDRQDALLGFGLSAIGRFVQGYVQNTTSMGTYVEKLEAGILPVEKGFVLSTEDRLRAEVIETLMCGFEADTGEICARHGFPRDFLQYPAQAAADFCNDGLLEIEGAHFKVTEAGKYFVRSICAGFDAYIQGGSGLYAKAV